MIEELREDINKGEMVIAHGNYKAKCQFCCWSLMLKVLLLGFMFQ